MSKTELQYPPFNPVFFIGASAGGVNAMQELAKAIPEDFPAPLFFLLHRKTDNKNAVNKLPELLQHVSKLNVVVPEDGDIINSRHIYLPKIDHHLVVEDNRIRHVKEPSDELWRPGIDVLFKAAAREFEERTVCVLLTGGMDDGVNGLIEATYRGGITIAQSPEDAYDPILPLNALLNDHPVYVAPLHDLPKIFCELAKFDHFEDQKSVIKKAYQSAEEHKEKLE